MFNVRVQIPLTAAFLLLAGCPAGERDGEPDTVTATTQAECLRGEPFVASGDIPVEAAGTGNAHKISDLRWEAHDGCERFVIDLVDGTGAPATRVGPVQTEFLRELGVVRVTMRGVEQVDNEATDATFNGSLARGAYAVWAPEGRWTYVDLHLVGESEAHAMTLESPARVVVDLRPGGGALPRPPATEQRVVVLRPRSGDAAYPLEVVGYARTFEANVVARLEQNGEAVFEDFTTATAWADAWGHFSLNIPDGPRGAVTLHVGERSARDGSWEGTSVQLTIR